MIRPDGWSTRRRIGLLVPHADVGPESELRAMAPVDIGLHSARVPFGAMRAGGVMDATIAMAPVRAFAEPPFVDDAVELLAAAPIDSIAFGFTSSAYAIGADAEKAMVQRLTDRAGGIPVVAPCAASLDALSGFGAQSIALFSPPWFDAELNTLGRSYYEQAGFEVVTAMSCDLPSGQTLIEPEAMAASILPNVGDHADAVVIGGNGFRAVGVIEHLEAELGRPVVTANQVLLWAALRAAGSATPAVTGYGRLFALA
jgi:maleate isomerase